MWKQKVIIRGKCVVKHPSLCFYFILFYLFISFKSCVNQTTKLLGGNKFCSGAVCLRKLNLNLWFHSKWHKTHLVSPATLILSRELVDLMGSNQVFVFHFLFLQLKSPFLEVLSFSLLYKFRWRKVKMKWYFVVLFFWRQISVLNLNKYKISQKQKHI